MLLMEKKRRWAILRLKKFFEFDFKKISPRRESLLAAIFNQNSRTYQTNPLTLMLTNGATIPLKSAPLPGQFPAATLPLLKSQPVSGSLALQSKHEMLLQANCCSSSTHYTRKRRSLF
jgi:hypothetical protein